MRVLGISDSESRTAWDVVGAILHLGNIALLADGEATQVASISKGSVESAAKLLGVSATELSKVLCERAIAAGGQVVKKTLSSDQSLFARDAFAKAIYGRVFNWLVNRINEAIKPTQMKGYKGTVIGVLDIYGFEILDVNSFEQFCINYCNEKLQQLFIGKQLALDLPSLQFFFAFFDRTGPEARAGRVYARGNRVEPHRFLQQSNNL